MYNVGDAVALGEGEGLRNPSNYALFYAGEFEFFLSGVLLQGLTRGEAVVARCRNWPYGPTAKGGDDGGL